MPENLAETTPRRSYRAAGLFRTARLYWYSPPESPQNCGQVNPNLDDYHSDRMEHQQKTFPSEWNGSVRVDALRQSRQRHPGGGLLRAWRQYHASRCISPSDLRFFSLCRSPILNKHSGVVANCDHMSEWVHWVHAFIEIAMQLVTLRKSLLTLLLHYAREA